LRFTKVCFCPYTSEKQFCLNDINSSVMPRLDENQRLRAIGMLKAGLAQNVVARHFGCHRNTILSLWRRFRQSGNTRNHRRAGRPRVTSRRQDNHIRLVHLRNRFQTSNLTARSIPGLRTISSVLESAIDFVNITSGQDVPQSVQCCCLDTVQLG
jgi:transposase-like protein